jgi:hypothetical protein
MDLPPALRQALAAARLYSDEQEYCIVHLPAQAITPATAILAENAAPFSVVIVDKDEVTLILNAPSFAEAAPRLRDYRVQDGYRLLTFDLPLDLSLVGFMSVISRVLAEQGIPLMAFSAFERDHLLIPGQHFEAARQALDALRASAENGLAPD